MRKMPIRPTLVAMAVSVMLSGCGGGGGGGPSATTGGLVRPDVPFHTPVRIDTVRPVNSINYHYNQTGFYAANLSNATGAQDLIMAGSISAGNAHQDYDMQIWSWQGNNLVNTTNQWFSGTDNRIKGSVPAVNFADFDGDGRKDMYVAPYVESNTPTQGPGLIFFNDGGKFTRLELDLQNAHGHHSTVYDINQDGRPDIFTTGSRVSFYAGNRTFTTHTVSGRDYGGTAGSVAVADFLGNGTATVILTDQNLGGTDNNRLYSWQMANAGRPTLDFELTKIADLPASRFSLPKWNTYGFTGSHDIRALAFDFDNSGRTSAVIFSRPWITGGGTWPDFSEIQFNKNMGGGVFVDVTEQVLIGYDHTKPAPYDPTLMDVNNDGLTDIVLGGTGWNDNSGASVLIHTKEHKYVASYATVLKAFADQAFNLERAINNSAGFGGNGIVFVQGPDGRMYLATAVNFDESGVQKKSIYLSQLGTAAANPQATADAIRQRWPWMSPAQVNAVLAQSSTVWLGLNLLDPNRAWDPIGNLTIPGTTGSLALSGAVGGLRLNGNANQIKVLDSLGRDYNVNYSMTAFQPLNAWNRSAEHMPGDARSLQFGLATVQQYNNLIYTPTSNYRNTVIGISRLPVARQTELGIHYSTLPFNPFVHVSGSWGTVNRSGTFESVLTHKDQNWVVKGGLMYTTTEMTSGLVSRINPITSAWTEMGWDGGTFKVFAGVMPQVIAGSADISLPTGIDNQGRVLYTHTRVGIESPRTDYARFELADRFNRTWSYRVTGMISSQNQHNVKAQIQYNIR